MIDTKYISLIKVAELGSFTRAAEALSLSQPAVTQHIKQLEDTFEISLFTRSRGNLQLTKEGEVVVKYAKRMAAMENNLAQELRNEKERIRSLNVGITHTAESSVIIEALAGYVSRIDSLNLKILTGTTESLSRMLNNYELDFAFVEKENPSDSLMYTALGTDKIVLAVAPEHPLAKHDMITIPELMQERLILRLPDSNTRNLFVSSLESQNLSLDDFNVVIEIDSVATIKDLIRRNFGVSVMAKSACMDEYLKGKLALLPIEKLSMERTAYMVCRKDFEHPELIRGIAEAYRKLQNK